MKKLILSMTVLAASLAAKADIINCSFTEPFISSSYSMAQQTLTYTSPGDDGKNVVTVIKNPPLDAFNSWLDIPLLSIPL